MRLYYHKTDGGAEYLCSNNVEGTEEGSFDSNFIVRIDGNIEKDAELSIKEQLIAAAPELLEACKNLRKLGLNPFLPVKERKEYLNHANQAINKAEGK